jgi:hypothetical protein
MQTVHKFKLGRKNNTPVTVDVPKGAFVIHMDYDTNTKEYAAWAVVDVNPDFQKMEQRTFYISGTGHDLNANLTGEEILNHINSFGVLKEATMSGWFHAFEVRTNEAE